MEKSNPLFESDFQLEIVSSSEMWACVYPTSQLQDPIKLRPVQALIGVERTRVENQLGSCGVGSEGRNTGSDS